LLDFLQVVTRVTMQWFELVRSMMLRIWPG